MNRRILSIPLGIALIAIIGASLAPLFLTPKVSPCAYLSAPVRFLKIDSRPVKVSRGTRPFPVVEYSYVVSGTSYTSTRMFCSESDGFKANWSKVDRFFHVAKNGGEIVAWFPPLSPESACISIDAEFDYFVVSSTSSQCRAD
ncbi:MULTISPECIES: hypothetical protein [unclassified Acidovorax]|uniref:hypothetical protein n=1 Tax=unclassified Acidovorax TaxID=2684926 RepID=UPI001C48F3F5|nr:MULTISPECIES: hypothetical protein [unclassified Acidovorax]MBV7459537.1 hypothetical protein [Acidovorax sp. sif0632]MBV7464562.1 hypothetical protein [Acidovorax sp. sif0613]